MIYEKLAINQVNLYI